MKSRIALLVVAALLLAGAAVVRLWLAATGSYSGGGPAVPLRMVSTLALVGGSLLAGVAVAWPWRKPRASPERAGTARDESL